MNGPKKGGHTMLKVNKSSIVCSNPSIDEAIGIWLSPAPESAPILTLFGSTNLNSRSSHLDTELSFIMVTSSDVLRKCLKAEVEGLRRWAGPWKGGERKVPWTTKAIVGIVGGML